MQPLIQYGRFSPVSMSLFDASCNVRFSVSCNNVPCNILFNQCSMLDSMFHVLFNVSFNVDSMLGSNFDKFAKMWNLGHFRPKFTFLQFFFFQNCCLVKPSKFVTVTVIIGHTI